MCVKSGVRGDGGVGTEEGVGRGTLLPCVVHECTVYTCIHVYTHVYMYIHMYDYSFNCTNIPHLPSLE